LITERFDYNAALLLYPEYTAEYKVLDIPYFDDVVVVDQKGIVIR
jgi:hypothetical protein